MKKRYFLHGRELSQADLAQIKAEVEAFDSIEHIDDEVRAVIEGEWPELARDRLPPRRPS